MSCGHATSVVALWTPGNEIAVAADSINIAADGVPREPGLCKIQQLGDVIFSAAGMYSDSAFDVFAIARDALNTGGSVEARIERFEKAVVEALTRIANDSDALRTSSMLRQRVEIGSRLVETIFAYILEGQSARMSWTVFVPVKAFKGIKIDVVTRSGPGVCTGKSPYLLALGNYSFARSYAQGKRNVLTITRPSRVL